MSPTVDTCQRSHGERVSTHGAGDSNKESPFARLLIPSFGQSARETGAGTGAESLNVAVATAVTLSEFRRR